MSDLSAVPKWATTQTRPDESVLVRVDLAEAVKAVAARWQEDLDRALDLATTVVVPPDPVERDRQAVTAIVAGWDVRRRS